MSCADKRTSWTFWVSRATVLIGAVALPWLACLTCFTCVLFESGAGLLQYRYTVKGDGNG